MHQGKGDVAEEDLHSFLEVAEDLNVKGLCENITDHFESNEEDPSQYFYQWARLRSFYFGCDLMIESPRHMVALSNNYNNNNNNNFR